MEEVKYFKLNEYQDYILLTSNEDIYFLYDKIIKLSQRNRTSEFTILVDMFYRNGFSFNRFAEITCKKGIEVSIRIVNARNVSEDIKNNTRNYFKDNAELLENSTLPKSIKNFVFTN